MPVDILFLLAFILLIAESIAPTMGLMGFAGFVAYIIGMVIMIQTGQSDFYGLSIQSIIALGLSFFIAFGLFIVFLQRSRKKTIQTGIEHMVGNTATVKDWKNGKGIVTFEGEDWRATSDKDYKVGDIVTIQRYDKMTLTVKLASSILAND